jgi:HlyD family secretion protein
VFIVGMKVALGRNMDIARQAPTGVHRGRLAGVIVGTVVLGVVVATAWRSSAAAAGVVERSSVWTERVRRGDLLRQVPVQGVLAPERVQWLSAVSAARVARIAVRPGAQVEPDSVILVLENAELDLAALEAERQAASAESASCCRVKLPKRTKGI